MNAAIEMEVVEGDRRGRIAVLQVQGKLDATTAPMLLERCAQIQANGQDLVVSMAGVSFLGSSGVGAMLVLVEQFTEQAGKIHFAALSEPVSTVVDLLDLTRYLPVYGNVDEAIAAMEG